MADIGGFFVCRLGESGDHRSSDPTKLAHDYIVVSYRYGVGRTLDRLDIGEFNNLSGSHKMSLERLTEIGSSKNTDAERDLRDKIRSMEGVYIFVLR